MNRRLGSFLLFLLLLIVVGILGGRYLTEERVVELRLFIASAGAWGPFVFVALYTVLSAVGFPASVLTLSAPILFGTVPAFFWVVVGSNLGASAAFAWTRAWGRGPVQKLIPKRFETKTLHIERNGFRYVLAARLIPAVPFNVFNFLCGLAPLSWKHYALGTLIGMLPGTFLYVGLGGVLERLIRL
jgi:uncharacterized membrane protein YdjX (TVP38/TMEM64 family)